MLSFTMDHVQTWHPLLLCQDYLGHRTHATLLEEYAAKDASCHPLMKRISVSEARGSALLRILGARLPGQVVRRNNADLWATRTLLVQGDVVFFGGTIFLQNVPDCSLQDYAATVQRLSLLDFDAHLPGHLGISLSNGKRHITAAAETFAKLGVPKNLV